MGDHIGDCIGGFKGDTWSLDYGSYCFGVLGFFILL